MDQGEQRDPSGMAQAMEAERNAAEEQANVDRIREQAEQERVEAIVPPRPQARPQPEMKMDQDQLTVMRIGLLGLTHQSYSTLKRLRSESPGELSDRSVTQAKINYRTVLAMLLAEEQK